MLAIGEGCELGPTGVTVTGRSLALRGSASSTFRGPVLLQQPNPLTSLQFVPQFATVRLVDNFGNPNLKPEEADNFSVGAVISAGSFAATIDFFDIRLQGKVIPENGSDVLAAFIGTGATAINNCGRPGFEALQALHGRRHGSAGRCTQGRRFAGTDRLVLHDGHRVPAGIAVG